MNTATNIATATIPRHPFFVDGPVRGADTILRTPPAPLPGTYLAMDCESALIEVSVPTPEMISVQLSKAYKGRVYGADLPSMALGVQHCFEALERGTTVIAHNGFYDWALMLNALGWPEDLLRLVTLAMSDGRIRDTFIRAKLHAIEMGWGDSVQFNLEALAKRYCNSAIAGKHGDDIWRLRYVEMRGIPSAQWPAAAYEYAYLDPIWVERVWDAMNLMCSYYPDEQFQTAKMWALHLAGVWGITIDQQQVDWLETAVEPFIEEGMTECLKIGVYRKNVKFDDEAFGEWLATLPGGDGLKRTGTGKVSLAAAGLKKAFGGVPGAEWILGGKDYWRMVTGEKFLVYSEPSKDTKLIESMVHDYWLSVTLEGDLAEVDGERVMTKETHPDRFTETGRLKTDRDTIELVPELLPLAEMGQFVKIKTTYLPSLKQAAPTLHPRHDPLKATGRNAASNPNINNVFKLPGVRECYVAREGYLIGTADYSQAELCSFAQVQLDLFGQSVMADRIREGYDLHLYLLYEIFGIGYEEAIRRYKEGDSQIKLLRQYMKAPNFGLPGGMGVKKFLLLAMKQYGIPGLNFDTAKQWKEGWMRTWPEAPRYLRYIGDKLPTRESTFDAVQHRSGRVRGGVKYSDGANTFFQGLTADGAGLALINVQREAWLDKSSPIYGLRVWGFVYDELLVELPDRGPAANTACMARVAQIMKESMEVFTPDVPATIEYEIARVWSKNAKATYNAEGLLIPWEYQRKELTK